MMHDSLTRLQNLLVELGAEVLIDEVRWSTLVTLMVENFFSIMRQDDLMPTQLKYGIRRAACVRELKKGCIVVISTTLLVLRATTPTKLWIPLLHLNHPYRWLKMG